MTKQQCQRNMTSSDFLEAIVVLEERRERDNCTATHHYLAQIAQILANVFRPEGEPARELKEFLLKFEAQQEQPAAPVKLASKTKRPRKPSKQEIQRRLAISKSFWLTGVGLGMDGAPLEGVQKRGRPPAPGNSGG